MKNNISLWVQWHNDINVCKYIMTHLWELNFITRLVGVPEACGKKIAHNDIQDNLSPTFRYFYSLNALEVIVCQLPLRMTNPFRGKRVIRDFISDSLYIFLPCHVCDQKAYSFQHSHCPAVACRNLDPVYLCRERVSPIHSLSPGSRFTNMD